MSKNKGYFAQRKADKAKAAKRARYDQVGKDLNSISAGVSLVATIVGGIATVIAWASKSDAQEQRSFSQRDQLLSLVWDSRSAATTAGTRRQRKAANHTRAAAEEALEALAQQRADADAAYAKAVHMGVELYRSTPTPEPTWWPKGVSM